LNCPWCNNKIKVERVSKNKLAFTFHVYCAKCPFEVRQKSSPLVKAPSRKRRQPDIQLITTLSSLTLQTLPPLPPLPS